MFDDTPLVIAQDKATFAEVVDRLSKSPVIGIDTESDSFYHYQEKVCLIQFSDNTDTDYIVDPLAIDDISALGPILADRNIVKILHGGDYDVVCLKRDFDFKLQGLFDTLIGAQLLGYDRIGLADLINRFFGFEPDKKFQRHDWARRPLKKEHLDYARGDTHFLLALRELMTRHLKDVRRMSHMREECRLLEKRKWEPKPFDPDGYLRMKGSRNLDDTSKRVLRRLWLLRDERARKADRPAFKTFPDSVMIKIAKSKPTSRQDLDRLFRGKRSMKRRYGKDMVHAVRQGLDDDFDVPNAPKRKKKKKKRKKGGPKSRLRGRAAERVFGELKSWRNHIVDTDPMRSPFTVASNAILKRIASVRPVDKDELKRIPDVRKWQVKDFGDEILELLDKVSPQ